MSSKSFKYNVTYKIFPYKSYVCSCKRVCVSVC